jgi:hypothetical protein
MSSKPPIGYIDIHCFFLRYPLFFSLFALPKELMTGNFSVKFKTDFHKFNGFF